MTVISGCQVNGDSSGIKLCVRGEGMGQKQ